MIKTNRFASFQEDVKPTVEQLPEGVLVEAYTRPIICLEGFECPEAHAEFTLGVEADFYNPHAEIVTMETMQMDEELKKRFYETVFMFAPSKPGIFALGEAAVKASNHPEKTIFIISEQDLTDLKEESHVARNIITMLKDQKVGIFSNIAEAKEHVTKQLTGDLVAKPVPETMDVDKLEEIV